MVLMETLRAQTTREKAQKVREEAMKRFGYSKGSISMAVNEALDAWIKKPSKKKQKKVDWSDLRGVLKDVKMSSVELQHKAFLLREKHY